MEMPLPDAAVIARRDEIAAALRAIVPGEAVIVSEPLRRAYESDGLTAYRQPPLVVVLPSTVDQVAAVLRYCPEAGGNVAENSGGVHCLKYGLTTNNLLGLEIVLMDGEIVRLGGKHCDAGGYDLMGVMTGSEGLLGVVTEVTVRILRKPPTARALLIG